MTTERRKLLKVLVGLGHRVAYATLIGLSTWVMALFPIGLEKSRVMTALVVVLDYPVAAAGPLLPHAFQGIDLIFRRGVGEFMSAEEVWRWHLRALCANMSETGGWVEISEQ